MMSLKSNDELEAHAKSAAQADVASTQRDGHLPWDVAHSTELLQANAENLSDNCIKDFFNVTEPATRGAPVDRGDNPTVCQTCLHLDFTCYQSTGPPVDEWGERAIHTDMVHNLRLSARSCVMCFVLFCCVIRFFGVFNNTGRLGVADVREKAVDLILAKFRIILHRDGNPQLMVGSTSVYRGGSAAPLPHPLCLFARTDPRNDVPAPWRNLGLSRPIFNRLTLDNCVSFIRPLLEQCLTSHSHHSNPLSQLDPQRSPKRLLYVGDPKAARTAQSTRVVEARQICTSADDMLPRYMALSHCWGPNTPGNKLPLTTSSNYADRCREVPWEDLSTTFKHAVQITRCLGVEYIWMDSLCIIQDDYADWKAEAAKMQYVYSDAYLTLSTSGSLDGSGGCLFQRGHRGANTPSAQQEEEECLVYALNVRNEGEPMEIWARKRQLRDAHLDLSSPVGPSGKGGPLLDRAWCFQERMLSTRILHLHGEEMIWECAAGSACECTMDQETLKATLGHAEWNELPFYRLGYKQKVARVLASPLSSPNADPVLATTREQIFETWRKVVQTYSRMSLTKEDDRFAALAGLAQRFKDVLGCRYLAGLWDNEQELPKLLLWAQYATGRAAPSQNPDEARRVPGIPTWSWASVHYHRFSKDPASQNKKTSGWHGAHYIFVDTHHTIIDPLLKILRVSWSRSGNASTGADIDDLMRPPSDISIFVEGLCVLTTLDLSAPTVYLDLVASLNLAQPQQECHLLFMATSIDADKRESRLCLMLQRLASGQFERFGLLRVDLAEFDKLFKNGRVMEVELA
ncbi:heterokaryon incompatibility protein-domain-containing protein [Immersiella caudata]|uniref:Heterokaryon incompatibility protein-domain-containing protein n=1 Tax=Immersiella caudata TaxID=314043 RepID=A0AA39WG23_9PEZI|nr:heterokaryon incompatibility protein-domain-containing protein [Immersiella caudata]